MTRVPIKIFLIEDNPADALLLKECLLNDPLTDFQVTVAEQLSQGLAELDKNKFDVLLLDLGLPDSQGLETFETAHKKFPNIPTIVLSGMSDELLALQAVQSGAQDYLVKGNAGWNLGPRAIRHAIERHQSQLAVHASEARFSAFFQSSPTPTAITRLSDNRLLEINQAWTQMTGYTSAEVIGQTIDELDIWVNFEERQQIVEVLRKNGVAQGFEFQMQRKNGEIASMLFSAELIELGGETCMLSMALDITERKQAELLLSESEERYRTTLNNMMEGCQIIDYDWRYIYVNLAAAQQGRSTAENLLMHTMMEIYPGIEDTLLFSVLKNCMEDRRTARLENEFVYPDGRRGWFELSIQPVPEGLFILSVDITERKQAEEKITQAERRSLALIENAPDGIVLIGLDGKYKYASPAALRMFGFTKEDVFSSDPYEQTHPEDLSKVLEALQDVIEHPDSVQTIQYRFMHHNGSWHWIESTFTNLINETSVQAIVINFRDITERKQAEDAAKKSEEKYHALVQGIQVGVVVHSPDTSILFSNQKAAQLLGLTFDQMLGKTAMDPIWFFIREDGTRMPIEEYPVSQAMAADIPLSNPILGICRPDQNDPIWVQYQAHQNRDTDGKLQQVIVTFTDITANKQAENALHKSLHNLEKAERIAHLGHYEIEVQTGKAAWSQEVFWMFGLNPAHGEPSVEEYNQLVHPEDAAKVYEMFAKSASQGIPFDLVYRILRSDGQIRYVHSQAEAAKDEQGQVIRLFGTFQDITESRRIEAELAERHATLNAILESAMTPVFSLDRDYRYTSFNSAHAAIMKTLYGVDIKIGQNMLEYQAASEDRDVTRRNFDRALSGQQIVGYSYSGDPEHPRRYFEVTHNPIHNTEGEIIGVSVFASDVTERKQAEERLQSARHFLQSVQDALSAHIAILDHEGNIVQVNAAWRNFGERNGLDHPDHCIGLNYLNICDSAHGLHHKEDAMLASNAIREVLAGKKDEAWFEYTCHAPNMKRWFIARITSFENNGQKWIVVAHENISTRKQAEESIHQHAMELELLYENGLVLSQLLNPKEIAQKIIELLEEKLDWHHTAIRLVRVQDKSLELVAFDQPGLESKVDSISAEVRLGKLITGFGDGLSGWAILQSKIVRCGDVTNDPHYLASYPGIHSGLYVPLKSGDQLLGVISIESEKPNAFSEADEKLIATLANQAAIAFENARLYEEIRGYAAELEQRVQERTAEIKFTQQRLELAVQTAGIGIWELDIKQNEDYWDDRLFTLYGLSKENTLPSPATWHQIIHPDDREQQLTLMDEALNHRQPYNTEFRVTWPDGSIHYIKSTGVVIRDAAGVPERMIGANQDITIHKLAEETLRLANVEMERGLRIKNEFLANMSHELRTPLNAILGISESLEEQISGTLNEKQIKYVRIINESGHHLLDMINDILDLSKIEADKLELNIQLISVEKLCTSSLRMIKELAQKKSLNISFKPDKNVKVILGDERRLKQSLVNLLGNAVKFTPQGKSIGLEVKGNAESDEVSFTVWDEGIGIPQEDIKRLFKPFVQLNAGLTREYSGTGLGLALVAQMMRLHGGRIDLKSELKMGSRFIITLPWKPSEQEIQPQVKPQILANNQEPLKKYMGKILIADDTELVSQFIGEYLRHKGFETIIANNGREAILLASQEHPQIILMDVMMPVMNGLEATKQIRADANLKNIPIIGLTALAMPSDREECLAAGMSDYLSKPIHLQELLQVIERYNPNK